MSEFHDDRTSASDAVAIRLSDAKLRRLQPELYGWRSLFISMRWGNRKLSARQIRKMIGEHLRTGDSRAALVVHTRPNLLVAAYTDEQDAVLLLRFPNELVAEYKLEPGRRLLTTNTYGAGKKMMPDIVPGPATTGRWANFYPIIAEFFSDDIEAIERRKRAISPAEWKRAMEFAQRRVADANHRFRDGTPLRSGRPMQG